MERSFGSHGNPGGWGNPFKAETRTGQSGAAVVLRYREHLRSPSGRWVRYRLHELVGKKCFCHCSLDEVCPVDEILKVMDDEQKARAGDDRPPDLSGMSLAEVGLAWKPRGASQQRRWKTSFCPTAAEISLSLEAGRAQLGHSWSLGL